MGQLVTDSRFSVAKPYSSRVHSTGLEGSLPFFEEKRDMAQPLCFIKKCSRDDYDKDELTLDQTPTTRRGSREVGLTRRPNAWP